MSLKKFTYISAYLLLPLLLLSLGSGLTSVTRVYIHSGEFSMAVFFGALVTSMFYARYFKSQTLRNILIFIFGVLTPLLYIHSSSEIFGSGIRIYSEIWSPVLLVTTLIGLIEIILYVCIFVISFVELIRFILKGIVGQKSNTDKIFG